MHWIQLPLHGLLSTVVFLTHLGEVMHMCFSKLTIIGPDNGLLPHRHQAIIWTNDRTLVNGHLGINFSDILTESHKFSLNKMHLKMLSVKCRQILSRSQSV